MECPYCNSSSIFNTDAFDATTIDAEEVCHDFECHDCGGLFSIRFAPVSVEPYQAPAEREAEA